MTTVAEDAGVSRQTVSNALNAPERLLPETLMRVQASIERLGYRPDAAARTLRTRSTRRIAYQLPDPGADASVNSTQFLEALCRVAYQSGYAIVTFSALERPGEVYDDLLRQHAVDAFLLPSPKPFNARSRTSLRRGVPYAVLGRPWISEDRHHSWIDINDAAGTALAVDHLVASRHCRIGFIGWPEDGGRGDERYNGWAEKIGSHGLPIRGLCVRGEDTIEAGAELAGQLLDTRTRPTALVCVSDVVAVGALIAIKQRRLTVGADVAVVGFGDTRLITAVHPHLTSLRPSFDTMATDALRMLTNSIGASRRHHSGSLVAPQLVVRGSSQPDEPRANM